jgi:hypothetical protein
MSHVELKKPCRAANGSVHHGGYVNAYCPVRKRNVGAHVLACEEAHGPKPSEKHTVNHKCRNRCCVEPEHLEWLTRSEQNKRENQRRANPIRHGRDLIRKAVREFFSSSLTFKQVADLYGLPLMTLKDWVYGNTNQDVTADIRDAAANGEPIPAV